MLDVNKVHYVKINKNEKQVLIPDYITEDVRNRNDKIIVVSDGDNYCMKMDANYLFLKRTGYQTDIPFDNYIPINDNFRLDQYKNYHTPYYIYEKFDYVPNVHAREVFAGPIQYDIFKVIHPTSYNVISPLLATSNFIDLAQTINSMKSTVKGFIPNNRSFAHLFQDFTNLDDVKVVFINFDISTAKDMEKAFMDNYPNQKQNFQDSSEMNQFLFLNASLTSTIKNSDHSQLWKPFMHRVVRNICSYFKQQVVFILIGNETHDFENYINKAFPTYKINSSVQMYSTKTWNSIFDYINKNNKPLIKW